MTSREKPDWAAVQYRPSPGTPLLICTRCGAFYLDDKPARAAHRAVFGHTPGRKEDDHER
jgi:hypothetical protein